MSKENEVSNIEIAVGHQLVQESTIKYEKIPEKKKEEKQSPNILSIVFWVYLLSIALLMIQSVEFSPEAPPTFDPYADSQQR